MRLICPNCGAQYEVGADVIPDDGRDVQCSNCDQTWFENPKEPSAAAEDDDIAPAKPAPVSVAAASFAAVVADTRTKAAEPAYKPAAPAPSAPPTPIRTQLDPSIADILREEAAREEAARKSESAGGLEQQADLGLAEPSRPRPAPSVPPAVPNDQTKARTDRLQGHPPTVPATTPGSRKELFPDIEEINSTLRSSADRGGLPPLPSEEAQIARRSNWRGFFAMITLIVILALIYTYADKIGSEIPALSTALVGFVEVVDAMRLWLDQQIANLLDDAPGGN